MKLNQPDRAPCRSRRGSKPATIALALPGAALAFTLGGILLCTLPGRAQPTAPDDAPQPTVTAAMGDVGGKIFGRTPDPSKTRRYFIAAEPEQWDFAPAGRDEMCGRVLPPPLEASRVASKLRYIQ